MQIIIDTDGTSNNTVISVNGKKLEDLTEYYFSMRPNRYNNGSMKSFGKIKIQEIRKTSMQSFFGADCKKIDELNQRET